MSHILSCLDSGKQNTFIWKQLDDLFSFLCFEERETLFIHVLI